jgi:hypothetical protein
MRPKDKKQEGIVNTICSDIEEMLYDQSDEDKKDFLGSISNIICQFDTDIAIMAMERLGEAGLEQAHTIKVNYGY